MASVKRERKDSRVCCENIAGGQESMHCSFVLASRKLALDYSMHEIASTGKKKRLKCCYSDLIRVSLVSHYIFSCLHFHLMAKWRESIKINMFVLLSWIMKKKKKKKLAAYQVTAAKSQLASPVCVSFAGFHLRECKHANWKKQEQMYSIRRMWGIGLIMHMTES